MNTPTHFLLTIGGILLLGLATDTIGRRTALPRVTLLLVFGVFIGEDFLDLIPPVFNANFDLIANMTLLMVGFLLGGRLTRESVSKTASRILWISATAAVGTMLVVAAALVLAGVNVGVAIFLGCIAAATDPTATVDVVMESGSKNRFSQTLLAIVAIDDAWGLILFSVGMAMVTSLIAGGFDISHLLNATREIVGAVVLGLLIGFPAAWFTGRIRPGQPMLTEALGVVFLSGGLALWLGVSFLITAMTVGTVVANFAHHHTRPFHAVENVEWPFMATFFVLAGASLHVDALRDVGMVGAVYVLARIVGKVVGGYLGGTISRYDHRDSAWMGAALLPQAGVAIGMALVAGEAFPQYQQVLLTVAISSTVLFEIIGPVVTRIAVARTQAPAKAGNTAR